VSGYAVHMNETQEQEAPELGAATDAQGVCEALETPDHEPTVETPDKLGGTGGKQSGGAG